MHLPLEQIDKAAAKGALGIVAEIDRHKIPHNAGQKEALDLPHAQCRAHAIANLDEDDFVAAAAFARRIAHPVISSA
jgi:hypothetical protein